MQALEGELRALLEKGEVHVLPLPDDRRGWRLLPVVEQGSGEAAQFIRMLNQRMPGFARLEPVRVVERLPRTDLGKIDVAVLREEIEAR
ncbi:MAG: hypothetical protein HRU37_13055 [Roseibacillus sp.]|nr:hypothetical protein [Roseibacillus sp.]